MKDFNHLKELLHWASGGALSASLAFIVFVPTLSNVNADYQFFSIACYVIAIPFLAISLARYKEYEIKKSHEEERSGGHISSSVTGFLFMVTGFAMLLAAIKLIYLFIFFAALVFMVLFETWEHLGKNKS